LKRQFQIQKKLIDIVNDILSFDLTKNSMYKEVTKNNIWMYYNSSSPSLFYIEVVKLKFW